MSASNDRPRPRPLPIPPTQTLRAGSGSSSCGDSGDSRNNHARSVERSSSNSPFTPPSQSFSGSYLGYSHPNVPLVQSPDSIDPGGSPRPPWWNLPPRIDDLHDMKPLSPRQTPPKRSRPLPTPEEIIPEIKPSSPPAISPLASPKILPLNIYPKNLKRLVDFQVSTDLESHNADVSWRDFAPSHVAQNLHSGESQRQDLIFEFIKSEKHYLWCLEAIADLYIQPLQSTTPTIIHPDRRHSFTKEIGYKIDEICGLHRRLLSTLFDIQRQEFPIIQNIAGPMFEAFILDFRGVYLAYIMHIPISMVVVDDELENNILFSDFHEAASTRPSSRGMDLKALISSPLKRLSKCADLLIAIAEATSSMVSKEDGSISPSPIASSRAVEAELLRDIASSVRDVVRLGSFQGSMNTPSPDQPISWRALVGDGVPSPGEVEEKRQSAMLELITGEMLYITDLQSIESVFIQPLRATSTPIIPASRLSKFIHTVFHHVQEVLSLHKQMLKKLFKIQRDEYPVLKSITAPVLDTALNWAEAYIAYFTQYPMAVLAIDQELAQNPRFKEFYQTTLYKRQDLKALIFRPVDRLAKISFPLIEIQRRSPTENKDGTEVIPQILEIIGHLRRMTNHFVGDGTSKAQLWGYKQSLVYPFHGDNDATLDLDLCLGLNDEGRTMVHSGMLWREAETAGEWVEVFVLLLDNYLIVTVPKEKDGATKYHIERRIALDLLTVASFSDPPVPRLQPPGRGNMSIFRIRNAESMDHKDWLYPLSLNAYTGVTGRIDPATSLTVVLYASSEDVRMKWQSEIEPAIGLRKHVQEEKTVFHMVPLSGVDTFKVSVPLATSPDTWISGAVNCTTTISILNEQGMRLQLIAAGCDEGIGMALHGDSMTWRRLMPLKLVTQCASLDDFGIFLALSDKDLYAYPIENLVPAARVHVSGLGGSRPKTFQKMNDKSVQFFTVGTFQGRTLVAYVMKQGGDSIIRIQEPVVGKMTESSGSNSWWSSGRARSHHKHWFRDYIQPFKIASTAYDCTFLKGKVVIPFNKGCHVLNLSNLDHSIVVPRKEDTKFGSALARRCEASRPLGVFPASGQDLFICYEEFGFWIDRRGDISRKSNGIPSIIEWECKARQVAFRHPYVLIFNSRFVEVRNVQTGQLEQFIRGDGVKCVCNGSTSLNNLTMDEGMRENHVQVVMEVPPMNEYVIVGNQSVQRIWELVPAAPLNYDGPPSAGLSVGWQ